MAGKLNPGRSRRSERCGRPARCDAAGGGLSPSRSFGSLALLLVSRMTPLYQAKVRVRLLADKPVSVQPEARMFFDVSSSAILRTALRPAFAPPSCIGRAAAWP